MKLGVYVHIPFCVKKCGYCDFLSFEGHTGMYKKYLNALKLEIERHTGILTEREVDSVFIGGGTPTVFPPDYICEILKLLPHRDDAEITVEANPGTVNRRYMQMLLSHGVNRLSLGLQSGDDALLASIGRIHNFETFRENYYQAVELGFKNINIDLMFALPDQSLNDWNNTLEKVLKLSPSSISVYSLTIEENTPFGRMRANGKLPDCDDKLDREMYHLAVKKLSSTGYNHYEISNFAKPGCECVHNTKYWTRSEYLGIGLGAHSFINCERYSNSDSLSEYISLGGVCDGKRTKINSREAMAEYMFLGLRLIRGVSKQEFFNLFGIDIWDAYAVHLKKLEKRGLLIDDGHALRLTDLGLDLANLAMIEFI